MAKKITGYVKLQIPAGEATPAPPVGPALGQQGVNIMDFCKSFNAKTARQKGLIMQVVIRVCADRSYSFITKTPPAAVLLLKAAGVPKGSGTPNKEKVGKVTKQQVEDIAKTKMPDLNAADLSAAIRVVEGTARSMGIEVVGRRAVWLHGITETVGDRVPTRSLARRRRTMPKSGKKFLAAKGKVEPRPYVLADAVKLVRDMKYAKFDESVDLAMLLGVDPKH